MILIALSWVLLLFFFVPLGITLKLILNLKSAGNYITIFLGILAQCLSLTICSFFCRIGIEVFIANSLICCVLLICKIEEIKSSTKEIVTDLRSLTAISKFSLLLIFIFSLFECSKFSYIIDNESYYIQTIKWINEYGFVKGLGNLHIFLGQSSPFHVLQAGFNFNFLTERSNDINGFILNLSSIYFVTEFEKKCNANNKIHWLGFVLVFNILFFQLISAPSPDLSLLLLSQIVFYYFLEKENNLDNFKIVTLLLFFLAFIKITIAPLVLIVFYLIGYQKNKILFFAISAAVFSAILVFKNLIITGYPCFPFSVFPLDKDWTIPESLLAFMAQVTKNAGYYNNAMGNMPMIDKLNALTRLGGINGFFNFSMVFLFVFFGLTKLAKSEKKYIYLYLVFLLHLIILLFTSPQYRFYLPEFIFISAVLLCMYFNYLKLTLKTAQYFLIAMLILPLIFSEMPVFSILLCKKISAKKEKNDWAQVVIPNKSSRFSKLSFEKIKEGNLNYNAPMDSLFFYGTANGALPCTNKLQLNYLKTYYFFIPQKRTNYLADGFYSLKTKKNE